MFKDADTLVETATPTTTAMKTTKGLKTYTYEEALAESIKYFKGDELAANVWINKYALKDSFGNIYEKTPDDMHWRMAREAPISELRSAPHDRNHNPWGHTRSKGSCPWPGPWARTYGAHLRL